MPSTPIFSIYRLPQISKNTENTVKGFLVKSNAPINAEDIVIETEVPGLEMITSTADGINEIASYLHQFDNPQLNILVHGYSTSEAGVVKWYQDALLAANQNPDKAAKETVIIGYRWPSEPAGGLDASPLSYKLRSSWDAFPVLPRYAILVSLLIALFGLGLTFFGHVLVGQIVLIPFFGLAALLFSLLVLRVLGYFRDFYRASNYGVSDLVELLRQIDRKVVELGKQTKNNNPKNKKVGLSFLAHSMGAFVTTDVVRIITDIFDPNSTGSLDNQDNQKHPDNSAGHIFKLSRLVLVAPDIPVNTLIAGRANFLASSLRRFEEAYLFSSEADLALRLASTSANYFSFPAKNRISGYRLGNLIVEKQQLQSMLDMPSRTLLDSLAVGYPMKSRKSLAQLQEERGLQPNKDDVAAKFVYLDCTRYVDTRFDSDTPPTPVLGTGNSKESLSALDYVVLAYLFATGKRDVHGGYFHGSLSRELIYGLWIGGLESYLGHCQNAQNPDDIAAVQEFSQLLESKGIRFVWPVR